MVLLDERPPTEQDALLPRVDDPEGREVDDTAPKIPGVKIQYIVPALAVGVTPKHLASTTAGLTRLDISCGHG